MRSLIVFMGLASAAHAQQVPTRALTKPEVEYTEPFSQLNSLYELRDGRVVVADIRDKSLQAIDLRTAKATAVGREGAGPQEWNSVMGLWPWRGDSVLANDFGNGRYLVIAPDGKPARTFTTVGDGPIIVGGPPGPATGGARGGSIGRGAGAGSAGGGAGGRAVSVEGPPGGRGRGGPISFGANGRASDVRGRIYSQGMGIQIDGNGNISSADSAPILRFDPATDKTDTIAFINLAKNSAGGSARGDGRGSETVEVRIGNNAPYSAADDWAVFRDGTVAILRVSDYHVEMIPVGGRRIVGRPVAYTPVKIGEAEKQEWRDRMKTATPIVRTVGDGPGRAAPIPKLDLAQEPPSWPAVKPPFLGGGGSSAAFPAPNGDLWVVRTRPASDKVPKIDVFNAEGQLIGRVTLPEKTRLVGFGAKGVYTARADDDDLQYLQRHALQWTGCSVEMKEVCGR